MDTRPVIFDTSDGQELRINMIGSWLRRRFGRKIVKLSLDGGFTCPNRDGSKGLGGCLFCSDSGSGDMASFAPGRISFAMREQMELLSRKWPDAGCIAYFQSHTGTYAPVERLRALYEAALEPSPVFEGGRDQASPGESMPHGLSLPSGADRTRGSMPHDSSADVVGLAIATRSDCITDEVLDLLTQMNQRTFLWVELGLQTIHSQTAQSMNLCHTRADYETAARRLTRRGIRFVTHLILGLPGESEEMMLDSVRYVCRPLDAPSPEPAGLTASPYWENPHLFGLKLHMLNVVRGSGMEVTHPSYVPFSSIDEYTDLVIRALELVPPDITIHRISGDAPRSTLIAPAWSYRKRTILNEIHRKMRERNTWQGRRAIE